MVTEPIVTLVVVPRETFASTRESLESIFQHTKFPFRMTYVDGGSPRSIRNYLQQQSQVHGFELLRFDQFLSPNRARNIGLRTVQTPFVVFLDNDVEVTEGWLEQLVRCAQETGASIVGPLTCQYRPVHETIHWAGGEATIYQVQHKRCLRERIFLQGHNVQEERRNLARCPTGLAEFHCVLVRREVFEEIGPLDEGLLNTREHTDFSLTAAQAGHAIYFEPSSLVSYVGAEFRSWHDYAYYMLRWSDAWERASLEHLQAKWKLVDDQRIRNKLANIGWRRRRFIVNPLVKRLPFIKKHSPFHRWILKTERKLNRWLTQRYQAPPQVDLPTKKLCHSAPKFVSAGSRSPRKETA